MSVGMMPVMATAMKKAPTIITRRRIVHCMHRWRECDHGSSTARLRTAQQVQRMQAGQPRRKRPRKALAQMQELFRGVKAGRKAHRLAELVKEIDKQKILEVGEQLFLPVNRHNSTPRSLVLTFSRWRCCALVCCFACSSSLRMEGFFSFSRFFAENSRKAVVMTSASRPLKNTR
ncbi:hypothetical protein C7386_10558 [Agathobaculum butyriciproducens]|nr:hypothetical protein C7386_10558 [Agathobaculum butyriciproducens]